MDRNAAARRARYLARVRARGRHLIVPGSHPAGSDSHPLAMVVTSDAVLGGEPHDLVHRAALALGLPTQQGGLLFCEPDRHRHTGDDTAMILGLDRPNGRYLWLDGPTKSVRG
jgi:hypothetical protein